MHDHSSEGNSLVRDVHVKESVYGELHQYRELLIGHAHYGLSPLVHGVPGTHVVLVHNIFLVVEQVFSLPMNLGRSEERNQR